MASLNLIKLCVGIDTYAKLLDYEKDRGPIYYIHTRNRPVRAAEILGQGSLYWVIAGFIMCRRPIVDFKTEMSDGRPMTYIGLENRPIATIAQPRRAFQGWRYLLAQDAPADIEEGATALPEDLRRELAEKGLL